MIDLKKYRLVINNGSLIWIEKRKQFNDEEQIKKWGKKFIKKNFYLPNAKIELDLYYIKK